MIVGLPPDVAELVFRVVDAGARVLLVGGHAVIRHGYPRSTGDLDLFFDQEPENVQRLWAGLVAFWGPSVPGLGDARDLLVPGMFVMFGRPPARVDLLSTLGTVRFADAWARRLYDRAEWGDQPFDVPVIGFDDLLQAKRDAGRPKDLADLAFLEALRAR